MSALSFAAPLALLGLAALPIIWIVLRITPPRPQKIPFPPLRILLGVERADQTPARTPWPLLLLRLAIAAFAVLACAGPIWTPQGAAWPDEPLLILMDDGWPAAPTWGARRDQAQAMISTRASAPTAVAAISQLARGAPLQDDARPLDRLQALSPKPFTPDRLKALPGIEAFLAEKPDMRVVWFTDGLENGGARAFAQRLNERLGERKAGRLEIVKADDRLLTLQDPRNEANGLVVTLGRLSARAPQTVRLRALDLKGAVVGETQVDLGAGLQAQARIDLPVELRNAIALLRVEGEESAGARSLLDENARRKRVGLVSGSTLDLAQPLLEPNYYLKKALAPYADAREARANAADPIGDLIDEGANVLILSDVSIAPGPTRDRLETFIESGGTVIRFAGSRLASARDDLTPVTLRSGGRTLGGALSWETPKKLGPFEPNSPFFGLSLSDDAAIQRQVLAEPAPGLSERTWAQLEDRTPIVTAERRGAGLLVLFHVTADASWSNLPISGLFPEMLRKILAFSAGAAISQNGRAQEAVSQGAGSQGAGSQREAAGANPIAAQADRLRAPFLTLDGFGRLGPPPADAQSLDLDAPANPGADHPPGLYGAAEAFTALNALQPQEVLHLADFSGIEARMRDLEAARPLDLRGALLAAALILFLLDFGAALWFSGARLRRRAALVGCVFLALGLAGGFYAGVSKAAENASPVQRDIDAALTTRLGYIVTGDSRADETSRLGLKTLSDVLAQRTSLTPGAPVGLDPARDELAFYPLIYWPIVATQPPPSQLARQKIAAYMKNGGTIVFDTRDALFAGSGDALSPERIWLRDLFKDLDAPELEPIPSDHVATKTFYLLDRFVGRHAAGVTWVEAQPPTPEGVERPARASDSVSPLIIVSNDLAGAWAANANGVPLYPLGEGGARQRELALRGGVNLVMYTLTGNYKADQVHVRDLMKRLGH